MPAGDAGGGTGGTSTGGDAGALPDIGAVVEPGDPGGVDVTFDVRADEDLHRISPLIYGTNGANGIGTNHQRLVRLGGNRWTAYNWENNASNAGSDWNFQNDNFLSASSVPGAPVQSAIEEASGAGAATLVTIPIVDYVSADKNGDGDVRNSGSSYLSTRFNENHDTKPTALSTSPDTSDGAVYQDEFVSWVKSIAGDAEVLFSLDNEPDLWSSTHAEVHPEKVTYAELWERNGRYARAVKRVWPSAAVTGFVSYGFNGYVSLQDASDAAGRNFIDWYLDQAEAAEQSDGHRLIDYLDLHWYPEARGGGVRITGSEVSADVVQARLQAPRSLWDSSYEETSWIRDYLGGPIDLLHDLFGRIDDHYPGTKLAFTEWNYGGGGHISGALATADVLGIFGREGVGLASYWFLQQDESFALAAFRAYCNYDGAGSRFGDTSMHATTDDVATTSVYASLDADDSDRVVLVAINKAGTTQTAGIRIAHPVTFSTAAVWQLTDPGASLSTSGALTPAAANAFRYDMPPHSVSVIVPE